MQMIRATFLGVAAQLLLRTALCNNEGRVTYAPHNEALGGLLSNTDPEEDSQLIRVQFALASNDTQIDSAVQAIQSLSDPASPSFGKRWSAQQVAELLAPEWDSIQEVAQWLNESGVPRTSMRVSADRTYLSFETTVGGVKYLLQPQLDHSLHTREEEAPSHSYSLPESIAQLVALVLPVQPLTEDAPMHRLPLPPWTVPRLQETASHRPRQSTVLEVDCFRFMSPRCLELMYGLPDPMQRSEVHPNNSVGIYLSSYSTWLAEDLDAFFTRFHPDMVGSRPGILAVQGGYRQTDVKGLIWNLEGNLDHEYVMALTYPQPVTDVRVGSRTQLGNTNLMLAGFDQDYCETGLDPLYDATHLPGQNGTLNITDCGGVEPPLVISISYAWNEATFSERYVQRQCLEYLKLGLRGITVIAGSGDRGTAGQLNDCLDPETGKPGGPEGGFTANFPASCPWITTVGGTQLSPTKETWNAKSPNFPPETALRVNISGSEVSSGGGFSNVFSTPFYQTKAVTSYIQRSEHTDHLQNLTSLGYFNSSGRGYPDISAMALNYLVYSNEALRSVSGTSASAPVFASMISMINDARLKMGKGPVGFINPVLYMNRDRFARDVQSGGNAGCGVPEAFPASEGWDPVTGIGTPDFPKLLELYLSLP